jgi:hypothetical protein
MSKMGLYYAFEYLWHKLWPKKKPRVKVSIWPLTTKNRELPLVTCMQEACHISLKISRWGLQFYFKPCLNQSLHNKLLESKVAWIFKFRNFGTPDLGVPGKMTFGCSPNWLSNSMPFNLFWTTTIPNSFSCDWSINVIATFYNSTCLTILVLMWKGTKG